MLTAAMIDKLNEQINLEFYSSNLYLQMSVWCTEQGFDGAADLLRKHSAEEMEHMTRMLNYVCDSGAMPILGAIDAPPHEFESLKEIFKETYVHEGFITKQINELIHFAFSNHDYSTFNFLQWYITEQHEEQRLFKGILDKIELVGDEGKALYWIDKDLAKLAIASKSSHSN